MDLLQGYNLTLSLDDWFWITAPYCGDMLKDIRTSTWLLPAGLEHLAGGAHVVQRLGWLVDCESYTNVFLPFSKQTSGVAANSVQKAAE